MKRTATTLSAILIAGLAAGCSEATTDPLVDEEFGVWAAVSPGVYVLNTQLRGIINPDIEPSPTAWGHVQVKLTDNGDDTFGIQWKGRLFNPNEETFSGAFIIEPDINPGPFPNDGPPVGAGELVFTFFRGSIAACEVLVFESQGGAGDLLPSDVAMNMILNPDIHEVLLFSTEGSVVSGRFGLPDPTELIGFNPQPDPPGKVVRCEADAI